MPEMRNRYDEAIIANPKKGGLIICQEEIEQDRSEWVPRQDVREDSAPDLECRDSQILFPGAVIREVSEEVEAPDGVVSAADADGETGFSPQVFRAGCRLAAIPHLMDIGHPIRKPIQNWKSGS
jgi:hypothetical protein